MSKPKPATTVTMRLKLTAKERDRIVEDVARELGISKDEVIEQFRRAVRERSMRKPV